MSNFCLETHSQGESGRRRSRSNEHDRMQKRKEQNRLAQQRCRQRKLDQMQQLQEENDILKNENDHLQQKLEDTRNTFYDTQRRLSILFDRQDGDLQDLRAENSRLAEVLEENKNLRLENEQLRERMDMMEQMILTNFPPVSNHVSHPGWVSAPSLACGPTPPHPSVMSISPGNNVPLPLPQMFPQQFGDHPGMSQMSNHNLFPPAN